MRFKSEWVLVGFDDGFSWFRVITCSSMREMVLKLISDELESILLSVIESLLSATYPESMEMDFFTLWAEEMLIEDNLILDILFIAYYESFCRCDGKQWKNLCFFYERMISAPVKLSKEKLLRLETNHQKNNVIKLSVIYR
ncbi:putative nucleoporin [Helianthus annuus]|nr:putative nucleoporin [Helianthus annuus]